MVGAWGAHADVGDGVGHVAAGELILGAVPQWAMSTRVGEGVNDRLEDFGAMESGHFSICSSMMLPL